MRVSAPLRSHRGNSGRVGSAVPEPLAQKLGPVDLAEIPVEGSERPVSSLARGFDDQALQKTMFRTIGLTEEQAQHRFGFLLDAFRYGVPPHGGLAYGLDRLKDNLAAIRGHVAPAQVMLVVKANAYGHGLAEVTRALAPLVDCIGVAMNLRSVHCTLRRGPTFGLASMA